MKLIIGNLKMNLNVNEINEYINYFKLKNYSNVIFAPTSIYLNMFVENGLNVASQDVSKYINGAYTGDISAYQLRYLGVNYALVGHSERRMYYHEDDSINEKVKRLLEQKINPILCVGESISERENGNYLNIIEKEIDDAFLNIQEEKLSNVIVAYEPIWSIGTGKVPNNDQIQEVTLFIKKTIKEKYHYDVNVLYGGSVNNENITELLKINDLDGYLVGGCSLKCEEFNKLIQFII